MKTENLIKAYQSAAAAGVFLRAAHADAIASDNGFAENLLLDLLEEAVSLERKLARVVAVAILPKP